MKIYKYQTLKGTVFEVVSLLNDPQYKGWEVCGFSTNGSDYAVVLIKLEKENKKNG